MKGDREMPGRKSVLMISSSTDSVVARFGSLAQASRATGYSRQRISKSASNHSHSYDRYYWRYEDDEDGGRAPECRFHRPVVVRDVEAGSERVYRDTRAAARGLYCHESSVRAYLSRGTALAGNYTMRYA